MNKESLRPQAIFMLYYIVCQNWPIHKVRLMYATIKVHIINEHLKGISDYNHMLSVM